MPDNRKEIEREAAETLALEVLAFIASDPDRLGDFAALTGVSVEHLRERAGDPDVLMAALEMLLHDEASLLMFSANRARSPTDVQRSLNVLAQPSIPTE